MPVASPPHVLDFLLGTEDGAEVDADEDHEDWGDENEAGARTARLRRMGEQEAWEQAEQQRQQREVCRAVFFTPFECIVLRSVCVFSVGMACAYHEC